MGLSAQIIEDVVRVVVVTTCHDDNDDVMMMMMMMMPMMIGSNNDNDTEGCVDQRYTCVGLNLILTQSVNYHSTYES